MNILEYDSKTWDKLTEINDQWTVPVNEDTIARAREGGWIINLTSVKPVPRNWFSEKMDGKKVLCLASGDGQQGPILAATGAKVTVFDNSENS
jgi:hypothetical protein